MARVARSRGQDSPQVVQIHEDLDQAATTTFTTPSPANSPPIHHRAADVLGEISANVAPSHPPRSASPTLEALAAGLTKLHIQSPEKPGQSSAAAPSGQLSVCCQAENQAPEAAPRSPTYLRRERRSNRSSDSLPFPLLDPVDEERVCETFSSTPPPAKPQLADLLPIAHAVQGMLHSPLSILDM